MNFCLNCGKKLPIADPNFCPYCGFNLTPFLNKVEKEVKVPTPARQAMSQYNNTNNKSSKVGKSSNSLNEEVANLKQNLTTSDRNDVKTSEAAHTGVSKVIDKESPEVISHSLSHEEESISDTPNVTTQNENFSETKEQTSEDVVTTPDPVPNNSTEKVQVDNNDEAIQVDPQEFQYQSNDEENSDENVNDEVTKDNDVTNDKSKIQESSSEVNTGINLPNAYNAQEDSNDEVNEATNLLNNIANEDTSVDLDNRKVDDKESNSNSDLRDADETPTELPKEYAPGSTDTENDSVTEINAESEVTDTVHDSNRTDLTFNQNNTSRTTDQDYHSNVKESESYKGHNFGFHNHNRVRSHH